MTNASEPTAGRRAAAQREPRPGRAVPRRAPDRRHQRRWVPLTVGSLTMIIGLADIIQGIGPGFYHRYRLHKLADIAPGTLTSLTRTADVIIGLALLMLSHGLRRRKRRAWEAVTLLLASTILIHAVVR